MATGNKPKIISLSRGGYYFPTSQGPIQFGIPPETIKDTMKMEGGVPDMFIVPQYMFDLTRGIALADIEFPIYFNFFIEKRKTKIFCTQRQKKQLEIVVSEALFGPKILNYSDEFSYGEATPGFPDLRAEMDYFRSAPSPDTKPIELDNLLEFIVFDYDNKGRLNDITVVHDDEYNISVTDQGNEIAVIDRNHPITNAPDQQSQFDYLFTPPLFGATTLGAGHGFDPETNTSGMIFWVNRRGIMIDPPVNSTEHLLLLGVSPKLIDSIILTHCHADHDAGTLQKLLQEEKIDLYTTATICKSFICKSAALTGINERHLQKLVNFHPVTIGQPMTIGGGSFSFNYTLHSIPTISIHVEAFNKSMLYSSDTLNEPGHIENLYKKGVMSMGRRDFLLNFPWEQSVIFHEAGIPPLHTPIDYLCSLPKKIRDKMYLVHVNQSSIPEDCSLRIAPTGLKNTIDLVAQPLSYDEVIEILDVLTKNNLFQNLSINKAREFLVILEKEQYKAGETIFCKGDIGDKFYIILTGQVSIICDGALLTTYSNGSYFGEKAIYTEEARTASAIAKTDIRLLAINKEEMISFVRGTDSEDILKSLSIYQDVNLRKVFECNTILHGLTPAQQTELHGLARPVLGTIQPQTEFINPETLMENCYLIKDGKVAVYKDGKIITTLDKGGLIGVQCIFAGLKHCNFTFASASHKVQLYSIDRDNFLNFLENNPGAYIKLLHYEY